MTPRERLEAAGVCSDCESNQCAAGCRCPCHQKNANQAAQLARNEAKETSDGARDAVVCSSNSGADLSGAAESLTAPVATSVSAPDLERAKKWINSKGIFAMRATVVESRGERKDIFLDELFAEYASSSSAALLAANEVIRRQLKKVCDQAEAEKVKCAASLEVLKKACDRDWKDETLYQAAVIASNAIYWRDREIVTLRDSRDRLQETLKGYRENHRSHGCHGRGTDPFISTACAMCCKADAALGDPKKENGL